MYLYAEEEFTLPEDFEEVKMGLVWLAERFLPIGVAYHIWYDPNKSGAFGMIKSMKLEMLSEADQVEEEHQPPLYNPKIGLYHVLTRKTIGESPNLQDGWKARKQLRYEYAEKERRAIEEYRKGKRYS